MNKKIIGTITIILLLLSPLLGGLLGRFIADLRIIRFAYSASGDALCHIGAIAWMAASIIFYVSFKKD